MPKKSDTPEQWRTYWREKERRRRKRLIDELGIETFRAMQTEKARRWTGAKPRAPRVDEMERDCNNCGKAFVVRRHPSGRWFPPTKCCSRECADQRMEAAVGARRGVPFSPNKGRTPPNKGRVTTDRYSCRVIYKDCKECGQVFVARYRAVVCSAECRKAAALAYAREWQRRTHKTAINYWRTAPTPEAQALAATYWELRQLLRQANG